MGGNHKAKTIGILVGSILDEYTNSICQGVSQQAAQYGIRTITLPGKYINRDLSNNPELMYEYQFNTIFSYPRPNNIDALICVVGSIGVFTTEENIRKMLEQYKGLPIVLIGMKLNGYTCITYDNQTGIREGLCQMYENGCRHFGMVSGNLSNTDVAERQEVFVNVLEEHGIPVTDSMITVGDLSQRCTPAFCQLLDNNPGLDAVFCVNDGTALGFYEELKRRGLRPGVDISILGYDNTTAATQANPPLSTIHADPGVLGVESFLAVLDLMEGKKVDNRVVSTRLIIRDSFKTTSNEKYHSDQLIDADECFNDIFYRHVNNSDSSTLITLRDIFNKMIEELTAAYTQDALYASSELFYSLLTQFLSLGALKYADINKLISCFENIYCTLNELQTDPTHSFDLRDTFATIYRRLTRSMNHQIGEIIDHEEKLNYSMKLFTRDILQFEKGNDLSYVSLLSNLDWLEIKNAFLYMFETPIMHLSGEPFTPPEYVNLKAVLKNGHPRSVPSLYQKMELRQIFYNLSSEKISGNSHVAFPLFYNETLYGIMLCDLTAPLYINGEFLVNQVSSATRMIQLLHANEIIQKQLEESLSILKENNIALDTLSKSDSLTGILNRYGFYQAAEEFLEIRRKAFEETIVLYIDMNNLKIINDHYGHEEGDFSLHLIGRILQETVKDYGIVGRIGGDEFACILHAPGNVPESFPAQIYKNFDTFNASSDKPYNVTVSVGLHVIRPDDELSLAQAMTMADEKLYEIKKFRKKEVAKVD